MKEIVPAKRTEGIKYAIRDVVVEADKLKKEGREILHLNIGDPNVYDFRTPQRLINAAKEAMEKNKNGYAHSQGLAEAREAIAAQATRKGIKNASPDDVIITSGASEGIDLVLASLVNPGERFIAPNPGYPLYDAVASKYGMERKYYMTDESSGWQPSADDIRKNINGKTKAIVIINPNNPTGALYERKTLEEIVGMANEHDLVIISDEIYDRIIYDGGSHTATASISDDVPVVTFGGLSKNHLAPGWRSGWAIFSGNPQRTARFKEAVNQMARARLSSPHPFQYAIKPALEAPEEEIAKMVKVMEKRRDAFMARLGKIQGLSCVKPRGAFYAFPKMEFPVKDDREFVMALLRKTGVLVVFGTGFGWPRTDHFRVVTLPDEKTIEEALGRIEDFIRPYVER